MVDHWHCQPDPAGLVRSDGDCWAVYLLHAWYVANMFVEYLERTGKRYSSLTGL